MKHKELFSLHQHTSRTLADSLQVITYTSFGKEYSIKGIMEEVENYIYLYEYRGKQIGTEFFISFSKNSTTYKLVDVQEIK
ncbi:MAG: hypothetical protein V9E96_06220 [Chitinophagaceae bacterium]|nr:hypothetical protein [Chitinophagaceae bacterium]MBP9739912.1 hypothetical protein [Chitinophagaceae bacterium]